MSTLPNLIRILHPSHTGTGKIAFTPTAFGRTFEKQRQIISREERAASGKLRRDLIATKQVFTLTYKTIDQKDLDGFENLFDNYSHTVLELELTYANTQGGTAATRTETYPVLMGDFGSARVLAGRGGLWENVKIVFTEV
jgi:hypothetical protein